MPVQTYLDNLYLSWQNNPNDLFPGLPINDNGENGYSTQCPPIPWFGNLDSQIAVISLEPKLSDLNFLFQVENVIQNQHNWQEFYLTAEYFGNLYANNPGNGRYWPKLAAFVKGYLNHTLEEPWIEVLANNIVEFPFVQYHSRNHPNFNPSVAIMNDFSRRLNFYANVPNGANIKIVYGKTKFNFIRHYLDLNENNPLQFEGAELYYTNNGGHVIVVPQNSQNRNYSMQSLYDMGVYFFNHINNA